MALTLCPAAPGVFPCLGLRKLGLFIASKADGMPQRHAAAALTPDHELVAVAIGET